MSVFTVVEHPQLEHFLTRYDLGKARGFRPISDGITNTNYQLETERGDFVLTLNSTTCSVYSSTWLTNRCFVRHR
jgi:homoserine kinase type II